MTFKEIFKHNLGGYNKKEKAYLIGGFVTGALTPIVGTKYLISSGIENGNLFTELASWGASLVLNLGLFVIKPTYSPLFYGAIIGVGAGVLAATISRLKRTEKERLNRILSSIEEEILKDNPSSLDIENKVSLYRQGIRHNSKRFMKKYNKKLSDITSNLNSVPIN